MQTQNNKIKQTIQC